jgi:hypothetical protein
MEFSGAKSSEVPQALTTADAFLLMSLGFGDVAVWFTSFEGGSATRPQQEQPESPPREHLNEALLSEPKSTVTGAPILWHSDSERLD